MTEHYHVVTGVGTIHTENINHRFILATKADANRLASTYRPDLVNLEFVHVVKCRGWKDPNGIARYTNMRRLVDCQVGEYASGWDENAIVGLRTNAEYNAWLDTLNTEAAA